MVYHKILCIFSISIFVVSAFNENQIGQELIYNYRLQIKIGTFEPIDTLSGLEMESQIHLQLVEKNLSILRLKNVKYKTENFYEGNLVENSDGISDEMKELLELPLKIQYDEFNGLVAVISEANDRIWSTNLKKSIAFLFRFNDTIVNQDLNHERFEEIEEETIYGNCRVKYIISPKYDDNVIVFHKSQNPLECIDDYKSQRIQELTSDNLKTYVLQQNNSTIYIHDVISVSEIVKTSPNTNSMIQVLKTNQSLNLVSIDKIYSPILLENESKPKKIDYKSSCVSSEQIPVKLNRQLKNSQEFYRNQTLDHLDEIIDYVDSIKITGKPENLRKSQVFNRIIHYMEYLEPKTLQTCFKLLEPQFDESPHSIKSRKFRYFLKILPFVGTNEVASFIVNMLIRKNKIDNEISAELIQNLGFHLKCPDDDLITEIDSLLKIYDQDSTLSRVGVLTFATILNQGFKLGTVSETILRQYSDGFVKRIDGSRKYLTQMLYIQALGNIESRITLEYLTPYINGEKYVKHDLKILALWSLSKIFHCDNHLVNKYLIPILLNRYQNSELRIVAYAIVATSSQNDLIEKNLFFLYWFMMTESDDILYNFHYNTLTELTTSSNSRLKYIAGSLLRTSRKPIQYEPAQGVLFDQFKNELHHTIGGTKTVLYNTRDVLLVYTSIFSNVNESPFHLYSIYIKIRGATLKIRQELLKHALSKTNNSQGNFLQNLSDKADDDLHIEIALSKFGQTTINYVIDKSSIRNIVWILTQMQSMNVELNRHHEHLNFPILSEQTFETEPGIPMVLHQQIPILSSLKFRFIKKSVDEKMNLFLNIKFAIFGNGMRGMKLYNPINDCWHGVMRVQTVALTIPLQFNLTINFENLNDINVTLVNDDEKTKIAYQNHIATYIYTQELHTHKVIKPFNSTTDNLPYIRATRGDIHRKNIIVLDHDINPIGKKVFAKYFECESLVPRNIFLINSLNLFDFNHQYIGRRFLSSTLKSVVLFHTKFTANENFDNCGFTLALLPTKIPCYKIKIRMGIFHEMLSNPAVFLKEENFDFYLIAKHENFNEELVRTYRINASLALGFQHRNNSFSFASVVEEKDNLDNCMFDFTVENVYQGVGMENYFQVKYGNSKFLQSINVTLKSLPLEIRVNNNSDMIFNECNYERFNDFSTLSFPCIWKTTLLYKYVIDFTYSESITNVLLVKYWPILLGPLLRYVSIENNERNGNFPANSHRIDLEYSTSEHFVDIEIKSQNIHIYLSNVPTKSLSLLQLQATNSIHYSNSFRHLLNLGFIKSCTFDQHKILTTYNEIIDEKAGINWTLYGMDAGRNFRVYSRKNEHLEIKIEIHHQLVEIHKNKNEQFIVDTNERTAIANASGTSVWEEFFDYIVIPNPLLMLLSTHQYGIHIEFNGNFVRIHFPIGTQTPTEGLCFH